MTITIERAEKIAQYMNANEKRAKELYSMPVNNACAKINADGFDFTADELVAFAEVMEQASGMMQEELSEDALEHVSGGIVFTAVGITAAVWGLAALSVYCACMRVWLSRL